MPLTSVLATSFENLPYESFSYWEGYNSESAVPVKSMFSFYKQLSSADFGLEDGLKTVTDVFVDETYIYILDSDNSRLIIADKTTYQTVSVIMDPEFEGETLHFRHAGGVFAEDSKVYICDTENERLIICDISGNVSRVITRPDSDIIPDDVTFAPQKLVRDSKGFFYLLSSACFYGAMRFDSDFNFLGFYGANITAASVADIISNIKGKILNNNQKISGQAKKVPYYFSDLSVDKNDFVYTVTEEGDVGQLRRLNPGGSNVYKVYEGGKYITSDSAFFGVRGFIRRTFMDEKSSLVSVTVDENDFIYVADQKFGRILVYDRDGFMLCGFGGGVDKGNAKGTFSEISSLHIDGDYLYAADARNNVISVFKFTDFGKLIRTATNLSDDGKYEESLAVWRAVLAEDANCQAAYNGIAKALITTGDYEEALKIAKMGKNTELYAEAFVKVRASFINRYFYILIAVVIVVAAVVAALIIVKRKKGIVIFKDRDVPAAFGACVHPFAYFRTVKTNKRTKVIMAAVFTFLLFFTTLLCDFFCGYMYGYVDPGSYNIVYTFLGTAGIVLLYTLANWGVCSIQGGKGRMYEVFIATAYSIVPLIVYKLFFLIISNVLVPKEAFFLGIFEALAWIFAGFSLIVANMEIHEYDFFKVLKTTVIILLGMGLVIFLMFMVIILIQQVTTFIKTIYNELLLR
ncbi:MAG: hypothetical protein IKZ47_07430 [Clostridia bacterium]|nr:hypothetical protein [Clostridia bacterium]